MINILIVGSGAREHALITALQRSPQQTNLFCCGTSINPGIQQYTKKYWVGDITDVESICKKAKEWQINLVWIGPEAPLEKGLADALWQHNIATIGPKKSLAQLETSKGFARELMSKHQIPGLPQFRHFQTLDGIADFLEALGENNYVVKANGLMGGKGVKIAGEHLHSFADALTFCEEIFTQKQTIVIEEKLIGQEFSFMCFCDGEHIIPMPLVQDHKRAYVNDEGPNTGGMGSYSDANHSLPFLTQQDVDHAFAINKAVVHALMQDQQEKYIGILYGSFIATRNGVYVIEFNTRFGDPESLNVLSILQSDFVDISNAMISQSLSEKLVHFAPLATVCKYAVPEGYPDSPVKNVAIDVSHVRSQQHLYLAAVNATDQALLATGSRTAAYVGVADTIIAAEQIAEREITAIKGPLFHRPDIGTEALLQRRIQHMLELRS